MPGDVLASGASESKEEGPGGEGAEWLGIYRAQGPFARVDLISVSWPIICPALSLEVNCKGWRKGSGD